MSIEIGDLIEKIVSDNKDVKEVLKILDENWHIADILYEINKEDMKENVLGDMTMEELIDYILTRRDVDGIISYLMNNFEDEVKEFVNNEHAHWIDYHIDAVCDGDLSEHSLTLSFESAEDLQKFRKFLYGDRE